MQGLEIGHGFLGAADVGFADDFDQGSARAVQVYKTGVVHGGVDVLAGIVFHMNTGYAHPARIAFHGNIQVAVLAQGQFVLGNLVPHGQVRIK